MTAFENLYEIIKPCGDFPYDDFALGRDKKTNEIVVIYAYDGGYAYPSWKLSDLLDIDENKIIEAYFNAVGKVITSMRPYSDKFGDIFKEDKQ